MRDSTTDRRKIADEAVGLRPESAIPEAAKDRVPKPWPAASAGPGASMATRTAEAQGERVGDAYAYPDATPEEVQARSRQSVQRRSSQAGSNFSQEPWMIAAGIAAGAFALGYIAALMLHRRQ
jgi:hypothetical protein